MSVNTNDEAVKIQWRLKEWFPDLSPIEHTQLQAFFDLVVRHNKTINLVSPKTIPFADALHFADSILGSQIIMEDSPRIKKISAFGSGNGFPGVVFAILYPDIEVTFLEADGRKLEFLNHVVAAMKLGNTKVVQGTIEALAANSVQYAVARGYGNISKTIMAARKPMVKGAVLYHMKGDQWGLEITQIPTQLCSVWYPALVQEYVLPSTQVKFGVVKTTKN